MIPGGEFTMGRDSGLETERGAANYISQPSISIEISIPPDTSQNFIHEKGPTGPKGETYLDVADPDALVDNRGGKWLPKEGFENHPVAEMSR